MQIKLYTSNMCKIKRKVVFHKNLLNYIINHRIGILKKSATNDSNITRFVVIKTVNFDV